LNNRCEGAVGSRNWLKEYESIIKQKAKFGTSIADFNHKKTLDQYLKEKKE